MISESLLRRATASDGRILRDRVLSGFGVRLNARKRTFLIAPRGGVWSLEQVQRLVAFL
jgi:hypothetical protein